MSKKIAILTDWLSPRWWAEKVFLDLIKIFPDADIFTTIFNKKNFPELKWKKIITSSLQKLPKIFRKHTLLMPFYPKVVEEFDFSWYDFVIWSSSNITKWIITNPETKYICYCHTPVRALWSEHKMFENDPRYKLFPNFLLQNLLHNLRIKDFLASQRVDQFVANSEFIAKRIQKFYRKNAEIIYPNCEIKIAKDYKKEKWEYFFVNCRLVPTKKVGFLIKTFNNIAKNYPEIKNKKIKILGKWPELKNLKKLIKNWIFWENWEKNFWDNSENIEIIEVDEKKFSEQREKLMSKAIAFLHPQIEDFWITPIEAQQFWVPVIWFWKWWILETVQAWKTWEFFYEEKEESLIDVIKNFDETKYLKENFEKNVKKFNFENFKKKIFEIVEK